MMSGIWKAAVILVALAAIACGAAAADGARDTVNPTSATTTGDQTLEDRLTAFEARILELESTVGIKGAPRPSPRGFEYRSLIERVEALEKDVGTTFAGFSVGH